MGAIDRRKTKDVLFYIFQCAKSDRAAFADCVEGRERQEALDDVRIFGALQEKIFGTKKSQLEKQMDGMELKGSIREITDFLMTNPEMFSHAAGCECDHCKSKVR